MSFVLMVAVELAIAGLVAWIAWSYRTWTRIHVAEPIAAVRAEQQRQGHLIDYHLGPNSGEPQLYVVVRELRDAKGDPDA